jgi:TRAP transporter TAXI family solute receptor
MQTERVQNPVVRHGAVVSSLVLAALVVGCTGGTDRSRFLSIATGGTGGVYYPYGGGVAKVLNEHLPGTRATAEVTAASVDNLKFVRDGRADLAFTTGDALDDAVKGRGAFEGRPVPVATLAALYTNYAHLVTRDGSGIRQLADLRGRVVSLGSAGSGTEITAVRLLRGAGLDPDRDVSRQALGVSESVAALKDGKVDAFFWMGGVPTPALQDLAHSPGITMRLLPTAGAAASLAAAYPGVYVTGEVPGGVYRGTDAPVPVLAVTNLLVVNRSMPDTLAYDITRTIFEHQRELAAIHPEARNLSIETAAKGSPAPLHPGAERYYRERGALQ